MNRPNRATLQEVANLAGVSQTTASLVLAGKAQGRRISESAHDRVRKAAEQLNYAPNLLVRSLRKGKTHVISFYNSFRQQNTDDLYMDKLSSAIQIGGGLYGYDVLFHCNFNRTLKETGLFLNGGLADGLLVFAPSDGDPLVEHLRHMSVPVVLLNTRDPQSRFPSVTDDCEVGMKMVADSLYELGHRRIAAFTREGPNVRDAHRRVKLLQKHLSTHGVKVPSEWVIDFTQGDTQRVAELMAGPNPPTAIFCWHDRTAYFALEACNALGIKVPEDVSIVGYDGLRWPCASGHVAASVHVDLNLLAHRGLRLLDLYIQGYDGPLMEESMPVTFSHGTTLGPAAKMHHGSEALFTCK